MKKLQIKKGLGKSMLYMFVLCVIYNALYMAVGSIPYITVALSLISTLGFYWLNCFVWKLHKGCFYKEALIWLLGYSLVGSLLVQGLLEPLQKAFLDVQAVLIILQFVGAVLMIFYIPILMVVCLALANHVKVIPFVKDYFKEHYKTLLNLFCICLLIVLFVDSAFGGMFTMVMGLDTTYVMKVILYFGNPYMTWIFSSFMGASTAGILSFVWYSLPYLLLGILYSYIWLHFVVWVKDHGTE